MKSGLLLVTALVLGMSSAHASDTAQTVMAPEGVVKQTEMDSAGSAGFILPLMLLVVVAAAVASDGSGSSYSD